MAGKAPGSKTPGLRIGAALLLSVALSACGGGGKASKTESLEALTAEEIYRKGELELETARRAGDSLMYFQEVERLYPYSEFARRALIMQAFVNHKTKK